MAQNYAYAYAQIDLTTGMCLGVSSCSTPLNDPAFIEIPTYDEGYVFKYYINGTWYEDAAGTIPYIPV
jgi:hypothetical protein